jgi:1-acyl-sn-glycerol-3-phosphate acyltransferase
LCYGILWVFFNVIGRLCFRYRVVGREHIPRRGGLLIAANHASYLDIPFLGCGLPRRAWFLGRQDLFPFPGLRPALRWLGWIPIKKHRLDRNGF